jgi:polysaccharide export outer membrane protein
MKSTNRGFTAAAPLALAILAALAGCSTPPAPAPAPEDQHAEIMLQDGDVVKISFPGAPNLDTGAQPIRLDGKITLPIVGAVTAAGMTPTELQKDLLSLFSDQLVSKEVIVTVVSSTYVVYVDGPVLHPGKITLDHPITVLDAIMEAGGFDYSKANINKVVVIRHKGKTNSFILDLQPVLSGSQKDEFFLAPGDIIHVPEKISWF